MKYYVDTNYAVRFLIKTPDDQYNKVLGFLKKLQESNTPGIITNITVFEIYWVLKSVYQSCKQDIIDGMFKLASIPNIELENRSLILRTLNIFSKHALDQEDCYHIVWSKSHKIDEIATFDKKLLKTWNTHKTP